MALIGLLWRLARHRWIRRFLVWAVVRLIRLFGWRRVVRLLFRGRTPWRMLGRGLWRATVWLLRRGSILIPLAWPKALRRLIGGTTQTRRSLLVPRRQRLQPADTPRTLQLSRSVRTKLSPRVARRRDEIRRSIFAAVGVDPDWRPPSRRGNGAAPTVGRRNRAELGERASSS